MGSDIDSFGLAKDRSNIRYTYYYLQAKSIFKNHYDLKCSVAKMKRIPFPLHGCLMILLGPFDGTKKRRSISQDLKGVLMVPRVHSLWHHVLFPISCRECIASGRFEELCLMIHDIELHKTQRAKQWMRYENT